MNISGIRPSTGFYDQNSIRFNRDFGLNIKETTEAEKTVTEENSYTVEVSEEAIKEARKDQTFGSYDYASQYKPESEHQLKGADSDISKLDIEKVVNDMKKDTAIHRYQYFVQNKKAGEDSSATIRGAEDFSL